MGPIEAVEKNFPFIKENVYELRPKVSPNLPIVIYQTRESHPENMAAAEPYCSDDGNPYNCRLVSSSDLKPEQEQLLSDFAQAFWF